jgi:response regulator RpfG family c-di-GMP phosphodiesterase
LKIELEGTECESLLGPLVASISRHDFLTSARISSSEEYSEIQNLHMMLIDDSLTIIKVAGRSLRQNGYRVTTANNSSAGLDRLIERYEKDEFHFVLMDLQMPVMDGIEAVRRYIKPG